MSPTCPTTIWSHLKLTSWNEDLSNIRLWMEMLCEIIEKLFSWSQTMQCCVELLQFNAAAAYLSNFWGSRFGAGAPKY